MSDKKEVPKNRKTADKLQFLKKNASTFLLLAAAAIFLASPDAKTFVLEKLLSTGFFDAGISENKQENDADLNFDFVSEQGPVQNTSSLKGRVVFINFWASWCPPCRAEFASIEKLYSQFKDDPNIFFLAVNQDSDPAAGKNYLEKENFSVPLYRSQGNVPREIFAGSLPTTAVLDKSGKIRFYHTGFANYASDKFIEQIKTLSREK